jgi:hypothetical protein
VDENNTLRVNHRPIIQRIPGSGRFFLPSYSIVLYLLGIKIHLKWF